MTDLLTEVRHDSMSASAAPVRNRYFYGKLLDADHLQLEQRYFLERGRLLNRLTLGTGVLCGLHVTKDDGKVVVSPGVAVDGYGREIVVTEQLTVDPWSLEREHAGDDGDVVGEELLILVLCYLECDAEPAPVLVADCEIREACVPGVVRERYALRVVKPDDWEPIDHITEEQCKTLFGGGTPVGVPPVSSHVRDVIRTTGPVSSDFSRSPDAARRALLDLVLQPACRPGPECVPLALVRRATNDDGETTVDAVEWPVRTTVYSNAVLLDLILCLAAHMEECCARRVRLDAPVITALEPAPGSAVSRTIAAVHAELFSLTFDHDMDTARLAAPSEWMRVILRTFGTAPPTARLVPVEYIPGGSAAEGHYKLTEEARTELTRVRETEHPTGFQVIVVARSDDLTQIADTGDPPEILDADYAGTAVPAVALQGLLWWLDPESLVPLTTLATLPLALPNPPALPSGNGIEGGLFHAWFQIDLDSD